MKELRYLLIASLFLSPLLAWGEEHVYHPIDFSDLPALTAGRGFSERVRMAVGDLNADKISDIVMMEPTLAEIRIFLSPWEMTGRANKTLTLSRSSAILVQAVSERETIGSFLEVADINGDQFPDLLVGRADGKSAYAVWGPIQKTREGSLIRLKKSTQVIFPGEFVSLQDVDEDGLPELFVRDRERQRIEIYRGPPWEMWGSITGLNPAAVSSSGILGGGDSPALWIGESTFEGSGAVFVLPLPRESGDSIDVRTDSRVKIFRSPWKEAGFGESIGIWDMNQDEKLDLLVSASRARRWMGMYGPLQASGRFEFEVLGAPRQFWPVRFGQQEFLGLAAGPPFRLLTNTPPRIILREVKQQENGWLRLVVRADDAEQKYVDAKIEFLKGREFVSAKSALLKGSKNIPTGVDHMVEWQVAGDLPDEFSEDDFQIQVRVEDGHFMYSGALAEGSVSVLDTKSPQVELEEPEFKEEGKVVIRGTASDDSPLQKVFFQVDGGARREAVAVRPPWNDSSEEFMVEFEAQEGRRYDVVVQALDRYGNETAVAGGARLSVKVPEGTFSPSSSRGTPLQVTGQEAAAFIFPNPYSISRGGSIVIRYGLNQPSHVQVVVYNINGSLTWQGVFSPGADGGRGGINEVNWDGRDHFGEPVSTGIYAVKVIANGQLHSATKLIVSY